MAIIPKKIKIVATMGPALAREGMLRKALMAGVDVFRLNFSHGTPESHRSAAAAIREEARALGLAVGILGDLQGPKIRIGKFADGSAMLRPGQRFELREDSELGSEDFVGLDYKPLLEEAFPGDILVLDDGKMRLRVIERQPGKLVTEAMVAGRLSNHKGINRLGGGLSAAALTQKDFADIELAASIGVDFLAVSFPKSGADMREARQLLAAQGSKAWLVAKIERKEAIDNLDEIIEASDGIMVARGDLALEVGDAQVPALQKRMIGAARSAKRFSITATQMLESMIEASTPTRAEVSDIANAVFDGTDAVMLSAESATGAYPIEAIEAMSRVAEEAGKQTGLLAADEPQGQLDRRDHVVAIAAIAAARHSKASSIVSMTSSGGCPLWLSRSNLAQPILAFSPDPEAVQKMSILRGVACAMLEIGEGSTFEQAWPSIERALLDREWARRGEQVIVTFGEPMGSVGGTDSLKMARISD